MTVKKKIIFQPPPVCEPFKSLSNSAERFQRFSAGSRLNKTIRYTTYLNCIFYPSLLHKTKPASIYINFDTNLFFMFLIRFIQDKHR